MGTRSWRRITIALGSAFLFLAAVALASTRVSSEGARTAEEQACFDADRSAGSGDWNTHDQWARGKDVELLRQNLAKKIDLIYKCPAVSGEKFADFFADLSVILARAAPDPECFGGDLFP